jgi:hypothetical protein
VGNELSVSCLLHFALSDGRETVLSNLATLVVVDVTALVRKWANDMEMGSTEADRSLDQGHRDCIRGLLRRRLELDCGMGRS